MSDVKRVQAWREYLHLIYKDGHEEVWVRDHGYEQHPDGRHIPLLKSATGQKYRSRLRAKEAITWVAYA
jgi:hypothetical protein